MQNNQPIPAQKRVEPVSKIPKSQRKTVETLMANDCRWPYGDPMSADFHFCGHHKVDGSPYCEAHKQEAFQAIKPRVVARPHAA